MADVTSASQNTGIAASFVGLRKPDLIQEALPAAREPLSSCYFVPLYDRSHSYADQAIFRLRRQKRLRCARRLKIGQPPHCVTRHLG
jgi:hypothetical protein